MDNNGNRIFLREKAANAILKYVRYRPPEYVRELWDVLGRPTSEWPDDVIQWLRQSDANFWNKYFPQPPLDNQ